MPAASYPIPLATAIPPAESAGAVGAVAAAAKEDHSHPRLTSATIVALDGGGVATVPFTRTFTARPVIGLAAINPVGRVVALEVTGYTMAGPLFTGCTIRGVRQQLLPALSGILLIGPLIGALSNFDIFGGSAAGIEVCVIALMPS